MTKIASRGGPALNTQNGALDVYTHGALRPAGSDPRVGDGLV